MRRHELSDEEWAIMRNVHDGELHDRPDPRPPGHGRPTSLNRNLRRKPGTQGLHRRDRGLPASQRVVIGREMAGDAGLELLGDVGGRRKLDSPEGVEEVGVVQPVRLAGDRLPGLVVIATLGLDPLRRRQVGKLGAEMGDRLRQPEHVRLRQSHRPTRLRDDVQLGRPTRRLPGIAGPEGDGQMRSRIVPAMG